jgi:GNAT superfamily N-acetyltransferase
MAVLITEFSEPWRLQTIQLVQRVFPSQGLVERLSLRLFRTPLQWLLGLGGIRSGRFWVAVRDNAVVGTVGLYTRAQDAREAVWLGWFCVAPEARGDGIGGRLLEFVLKEAKSMQVRYLRLYTSTDPNERAAQGVYERAGLSIMRREQPLLWRLAGVEKLVRQLDLGARKKPQN